MFFYRRYQRKLAKGKPEPTPQEKRKAELRNNLILIISLVIGFGLVITVARRFKNEVTTYDQELYVQKSISDMADLDKIEPLYTFEEKEVDYKPIEVDNKDLYEQITDEVYSDYEKYNEIYKSSVWKEYDLSNVSYFRFDVTIVNNSYCYYLIDGRLYKSDELLEVLDYEKLKLLDNSYVSNLYEIIELDTPKTFGDYVEYMVDLNYYIILTERQNSIKGYVVLNDDSAYELSLLNFGNLLNYLEISKEDDVVIKINGIE